MGPDDDILNALVKVADAANLLVFGSLALLGLLRWWRSRDFATGWFTAMFAVLAAVILASAIGPDDQPAAVAALALFPFLLLRFTASFSSTPIWVEVASAGATVAIVTWAFFVDLPADDSRPTGVALAFVAAFLAHWLVLSGASAWFFVRQSRLSPGVAARRMRLFALATMLLALLLLVSGVSGGAEDAPLLNAVVVVGATLSALLFLAAFAPPTPLRRAWLAGELDDLQVRMRELVVAETVEEVHDVAASLVRSTTGCSGVVLLDPDHLEPVAAHGIDQDDVPALVAVARAQPDGRPHRPQHVQAIDRFVIVSARTLPWFGAIERNLVLTISRFTSVAEERADVLERERAANEKLRQVDQLKSEFVAMVAHDIRSPMSVVTGFADTIHDRWDELDDARKLEYLRVISRNTRNLAEFVEDVLQVARMEAGAMTFSSEPFDARAVVERLVAEARVTHPHLVLDVDAPERLPTVVGDEARNRQILANLLDNARKFSGDSPRVQIALSRRDDEVEIAVRDNGMGIDAADVPLLFRRFSRVGRASRAVAGTGLGLYIVKTMVEAQGGRIWVDSTPGEGSTFTYTLPIASGEFAA